MDTRILNGGYVLDSRGMPEIVEGKAELLHYARLRLVMRRGKFPYNRELGSGLWQWSREEDRAADRALALANEALLGLPGVRAKAVRLTESGAVFTITTPLGEEELELGEL